MRGSSLLLLVLAAGLAGCGSDSDDGPDTGAGDPTVVYLRAVHAMPNAPDLRVLADGIALSDSLPYQEATALDRRGLGDQAAAISIAASALTPEGILIPVSTESISVSGDTEVSVIVLGDVGGGDVFAVPAVRRAKPVAGLYFQFAHGAPSAGPLDVYLTDPDVPLTAATPIASLEPLEYTDSDEVPFQDVRIRMTTAATLDVVYDSGTLVFRDNPSRTDDGRELLVTLAENTLPGSSPVKALLTDGERSIAAYDLQASAGLRVVQASPDAPAMDVVVGPGFAMPIADALGYGQQSALAAVRAGRVSLNFTTPGDPGTFLFEDTLSTESGLTHTEFLMGPFAELDSPAAGAVGRSITTEWRLRLVNAAPESDFLSLYVSDDEPEAGMVPPEGDIVLVDVDYRGISDYLGFAPGERWLTVTERFYETEEEAEDAVETVIIGPLALDTVGGQVRTLLVLPPPEDGGTETHVFLDDLQP